MSDGEIKDLLRSCAAEDIDAASRAEAAYREAAVRHLRADRARLYARVLALRRRLHYLQTEADRLLALYARAAGAR